MKISNLADSSNSYYYLKIYLIYSVKKLGNLMLASLCFSAMSLSLGSFASYTFAVSISNNAPSSLLALSVKN